MLVVLRRCCFESGVSWSRCSSNDNDYSSCSYVSGGSISGSIDNAVEVMVVVVVIVVVVVVVVLVVVVIVVLVVVWY